MRKIIKIFKELVAPCKLAYTWPVNEKYSWYKKLYTCLVYLMRHGWKNKSPWTMFIAKMSLVLCGGWYDNFDHIVYFLLGVMYISIESWLSYMDYITLSNKIKNTDKTIPWTIAKQRGLNTQKEESILIIVNPILLGAIIELSAIDNNKKYMKIDYDTTKTE